MSKPDECVEGLKKVLDAPIAAERIHEHSKDAVLAQLIVLLRELRLFKRSSHAPYVLPDVGSAYAEGCKTAAYPQSWPSKRKSRIRSESPG